MSKFRGKKYTIFILNQLQFKPIIMSYHNFYTMLFTFFKSLSFLVLGCIISCQLLVAQAPYDYWKLDSFTTTNGITSWYNSVNGQGGNYLKNLNALVISPDSAGCVGNSIMIKQAQVLACSNTTMKDHLTSAMAFEFLMKPNPTNGESKLLLGTQFGFIQWTTEGFIVKTLFENAQNQAKSHQIT